MVNLVLCSRPWPGARRSAPARVASTGEIDWYNLQPALTFLRAVGDERRTRQEVWPEHDKGPRGRVASR